MAILPFYVYVLCYSYNLVHYVRMSHRLVFLANHAHVKSHPPQNTHKTPSPKRGNILVAVIVFANTCTSPTKPAADLQLHRSIDNGLNKNFVLLLSIRIYHSQKIKLSKRWLMCRHHPNANIKRDERTKKFP